MVGYLNGWITLTFNIPSFVTTLGMLFIARSLATVLSGGFPPPLPSGTPTGLFVADLGLFRSSMLWYLAFILVLAGDAPPQQSRELDLRHRRPAPGGRRHGHRHPQGEVVLLHAVQLPRGLRRHDHHLPPALGPAVLGEGLELQAIAANVIGGTSLTGGIGSVAGFVIGTILIRVIDNGLVMARIDANWFRLAIGTLTILAVIMNITLRRRARAMRG